MAVVEAVDANELPWTVVSSHPGKSHLQYLGQLRAAAIPTDALAFGRGGGGGHFGGGGFSRGFAGHGFVGHGFGPGFRGHRFGPGIVRRN